MADQPYPPAYENREGNGRYRRRGFDRLLERLMGPSKPSAAPTTEEMMKRQRNPFLRRRMLEEAESTTPE